MGFNSAFKGLKLLKTPGTGVYPQCVNIQYVTSVRNSKFNQNFIQGRQCNFSWIFYTRL